MGSLLTSKMAKKVAKKTKKSKQSAPVPAVQVFGRKVS